jgi:hypothetical protein
MTPGSTLPIYEDETKIACIKNSILYNSNQSYRQKKRDDNHPKKENVALGEVEAAA